MLGFFFGPVNDLAKPLQSHAVKGLEPMFSRQSYPLSIK